MLRRADALRFVAMRLGLPDLREVVRQPGINEAYRITIQYHAGHYADQVATLIYGQPTSARLSVIYRRSNSQPSFDYPLDPERYREFDLTMRRLGFDRRDDQSEVPYLGVDLWLIERASGSFFHDVVMSPELADGVYGWFLDAVKTQIPLAIRPIQRE